MATLFMNPGKLSDKIKALRDFGDDAGSAKNNIDRTSFDLNDPMSGSGVDSFLTLISRRIDDLRATADRVESCKNTILRISDNQIAPMNADGEIEIDVHEGVRIDSPADLENWGAAMVDAKDLKDLKERKSSGRLPSGRRYEELLESIKKHKKNKAYANGLVFEIGPENLTQIPLSIKRAYTARDPVSGREDEAIPNSGLDMAKHLGGVLATASTTWDKKRSKEVSEALVNSVRNEKDWGRITVLNAMLGRQDANRDGVNDLSFGREFLVNLGRGMEELPWKDIKAASAREANGQIGGLGDHLPAQSSEPLQGVLDAMGADPGAAVEFLGGREGNAKDVARVRELMSRHDLGENEWTDTWSGLAASTSNKYARQVVDDDHPPTLESKQAAVIASGVVNGIGESGVKVSDRTQGNLSETLANYPYAADAAARQADDPRDMGPDLPDQKQSSGAPAWTAGTSYQPNFSTKGLAGVVREVSRDEGHLKTVADSVADLQRARMMFAAANYRTGGGASLEVAIEANSATRAFFLGASRAGVEGDAAETDKRNKIIIDALCAGSGFLPGPGEEVAKIWGYGIGRAADAGRTAMSEQLTQNLARALNESEGMMRDGNRASVVSTVVQLVSMGVIPAEQANAAVPGLVTEKGVDPTKLSPEALDRLYTKFVEDPDGQFDGAIRDSLGDAGTNYEVSYQRGNSSAGGSG
ncbi:DUF6571 family protein [Actinomyces howellii]|uniref:DUF6571 domain-containing protein n=1 Tax=Actinomyces howellii TaxID=52771 RepID=A0A448HHB0_9ACTO|nr:DUF6571 family protein [Actinomyces howellii]VEG28461.1 Uncharacterised protein [Actinomyces howellii]